VRGTGHRQPVTFTRVDSGVDSGVDSWKREEDEGRGKRIVLFDLVPVGNQI